VSERITAAIWWLFPSPSQPERTLSSRVVCLNGINYCYVYLTFKGDHLTLIQFDEFCQPLCYFVVIWQQIYWDIWLETRTVIYIYIYLEMSVLSLLLSLCWVFGLFLVCLSPHSSHLWKVIYYPKRIKKYPIVPTCYTLHLRVIVLVIVKQVLILLPHFLHRFTTVFR